MVLAPTMPPVEEVVGPEEAAELARIMFYADTALNGIRLPPNVVLNSSAKIISSWAPMRPTTSRTEEFR
jgi:hypothetical protein